MEWEAGQVAFLVGVAVYTIAAAATDFWSRRIPNQITVTAFALGFLYQGVFNGLPGLLDGLGGFAVGFGPLFVLWIVGSGGGGDAKLMGGLGPWLGTWPTLLVLAVTTVCVMLYTVGAMVWSLVADGAKGTKARYIGTGRKRKQPETLAQKADRRVVPFAIPVLVATWAVVAWQWNGPATDAPPNEVAAVGEAR